MYVPVQSMRLALISPPVTTVPPEALGGLDMVRALAEGLALRGHHVTLVASGLDGDAPAGYAVADTGLDDRVPPEVADDAHAELAGQVLERLSVDLISDHSRAGYLPELGRRVPFAFRTVYGTHPGSPQPGYVGLIPVSQHQYLRFAGDPDAPYAWLEVIHPAIGFDAHPPRERHDGPLVYAGPLHPGARAEVAIRAAHEAGMPLVLAGTDPSAEARVHAAVRLRPKLSAEDVLLEEPGSAERRELLAGACCVVASLDDADPFPLPAVEAMAAGTPVVGLARTAAAEVVLHGTSGMIAGRGVDLAQAVRAAVKLDPVMVRRSAGRFDTPRMVAAYEGLFARLLRGSR
jgi:glycosyltransferase involved in cell wall biosynthesis